MVPPPLPMEVVGPVLPPPLWLNGIEQAAYAFWLDNANNQQPANGHDGHGQWPKKIETGPAVKAFRG